MPRKESELEISQRAERIREAIAHLESKKAEIERNELVAPVGSYVARYQAIWYQFSKLTKYVKNYFLL